MVSDELYAPLGLAFPERAPSRLRLRKAHLAVLAPAALALAFSASSLDRHAPPPLLLKPAPAPAASAPASAAKLSEGEQPDANRPLAATSDASGVKVTVGSPGLPPGGVFINVREALAGQAHPADERRPAPNPSDR